jgi:Mn-containing catalase
VKDERAMEIEKIAKEWAKREYFRQSMAGTVGEDMTEEAFTESVWERAMFEGDLKYRQLNGEVPNAEAELESFKARQERKQQTMLKRAKEELKEILEEEDLVGADLKATLDTDDEDED